jgi:hypothetical protein
MPAWEGPLNKGKEAMNAPDKVEVAFKAWEQARNALFELRKQLYGITTGGQLPQSPEVDKVYEQIRAQEEVCKPLFEVLAKIAEQVADARQNSEFAARVARVLEEWGRSGA